MASIPKILWRLSSSDFYTFVIPNSLFGVCTAVCSGMWLSETPTAATQPSTWNTILTRLLKTILWNWINLLLFNLANQRLPESIAEDKLNKPYRPIVSGLLDPASARRALLYGIPSVFLTCYLWLGAHEEAVILLGLTWMYNDLKGGDESFVLRNAIIAVAFGVYNHGSARIIRGFSYGYDNTSDTILQETPRLSLLGQQWIVLVSLVVFTTMQIQDLQDVEGDRTRNRKTLMIVAGMKASRWLTATPILFWTLAVPYTLSLTSASFSLVATILTGMYTAWRVLFKRTKSSDNTSWKYWALWLVALYTLPLVA